MNWLLDQFRGTRRRQAAVVCYLRENGPIAYELSLFGDAPRDNVEAMFESGLSWYWTTQQGSLGAAPEWIELTRWSMAALLADIGSSDAERRTLVVGIETQDSRPDVARDIVSWSRRFATDDRSPLHAFIHQSAGRPAHVFVAQQPPETVRTLLQAWGIDRARVDRRAYPRLREQSLESLVEKLPR